MITYALRQDASGSPRIHSRGQNGAKGKSGGQWVEAAHHSIASADPTQECRHRSLVAGFPEVAVIANTGFRRRPLPRGAKPLKDTSWLDADHETIRTRSALDDIRGTGVLAVISRPLQHVRRQLISFGDAIHACQIRQWSANTEHNVAQTKQ